MERDIYVRVGVRVGVVSHGSWISLIDLIDLEIEIEIEIEIENDIEIERDRDIPHNRSGHHDSDPTQITCRDV